MSTDLDQWRSLSPKGFTMKLFNIAEENMDILPEKAYVGLMNAAKVMHERVCHHPTTDEQELEDDASSRNIMERVSDVLIKLRDGKKKLKFKYESCDGFKIYKKLTQKIKEEAIMCIAANRYGVRLPCATFECLEHECGLHILLNDRRAFFMMYLEHRNLLMKQYHDEYNELNSYLEDRISFFTNFYHQKINNVTNDL